MATPLRAIRAQYLSSGGYISRQTQTINDFLYEATSTINGLYRIGDRTVTGDGRVFKYSKANGIQYPNFGSYNPCRTMTAAVLPAQAAAVNGPNYTVTSTLAAGSVGSNRLTFTKDATCGVAADGVIAENELAGATIIYNHGQNQVPQVRTILSNPASTSGAASITVFLDANITPIVISGTTYQSVQVGTTTAECYFNPYANLVSGNVTASDYASFLGVPATYATNGQYFWLQTAGRCWVTSNSVTGEAVNSRDVYFVGNGSVVSGQSVTYAGKAYQRAGTACDISASNLSNAPIVDLMISI